MIRSPEVNIYNENGKINRKRRREERIFKNISIKKNRHTNEDNKGEGEKKHQRIQAINRQSK